MKLWKKKKRVASGEGERQVGRESGREGDKTATAGSYSLLLRLRQIRSIRLGRGNWHAQISAIRRPHGRMIKGQAIRGIVGNGLV